VTRTTHEPEEEGGARTPDGLVGRLVAGRYQLVRLIGRGGMGAVYEAIQLELARRVAVKVLVDCDDSALARFRQEALLVATIAHPNVVQVTDLVSDDDVLAAIVMELLDGESLAALLSREGKLTDERAVAIALQMLSGLAAAHERGIIHRDVKPSNVQVIRTGHGPELVKMLDFGIAKSLEAPGYRTTMGIIVGTPAYMAPEQLLGDPVDGRSDVYAVGACLYKMLTGERTTGQASGADIANAVLDLVPSRLVAAIETKAIADIVATALATDPANRWGDARAMAAALAGALSSTPAFGSPNVYPRRASDLPPGAARVGPYTPKDALSLKPGEILASKYRIEAVLGEGGMGVVVAAKHLDLDQKVALKFLLPAATREPALVERFVREARASVRLKSPHVARTLDTGRLENGRPYIVMEFLDGRDLAAELRARNAPLSVEEAASYVLQACDALSEAHALGIVHRDLKPANLFLTRGHDGHAHVKILDFGISKRLDTTERELTQTEMVFGSPAYMSPEQTRSSKEADARSDIWSVGVILYELATGRVPFDARSVTALVLKVRRDEPAGMRTLRPELPEALERLVLRCLEKDPAKRFANVGELASALAPLAHPRDRAIADRIVDIGKVPTGNLTRESATPPVPAEGRELRSWDRTQLAVSMERRARDPLGLRLGIAAVALVVLAVSGFGAFRYRENKRVDARAGETKASATLPPVVTSGVPSLPTIVSPAPSMATPSEPTPSIAATPEPTTPSPAGPRRHGPPPKANPRYATSVPTTSTGVPAPAPAPAPANEVDAGRYSTLRQ
jgi:eukaryotic-like serine/threonine-protein kinase